MQQTTQQISAPVKKASIGSDKKSEQQVQRVIRDLEVEMRRLVDLLVHHTHH